MYIFCSKQLATVWIKICVSKKDLLYKNTTEISKVSQSYLTRNK